MKNDKVFRLRTKYMYMLVTETAYLLLLLPNFFGMKLVCRNGM
jgi:hypothetical protein